MSLYYAASNKESTKDLFQKRTIYWGRAHQLNENNLIDFNLNEKYYYGRVYRDMVPICLKENTLKPLPYQSPSGHSLQAVNFVTDVFKEMALQFDKAVALKNISPNDPYLSSFKAYKAYESPYVQYTQHKRTYFQTLASFFKNNKVHFATFDDFIRELMPLLKNTVKTSKFTFSGFLKSKDCSILSTGLAFEIADLSYANDDKKVKEFLESPNWQFYINTCDSYGFMVDLNIPWRIVADLDSDITTEIGARYGMPNLEMVFSRAYRSAPIVNLQSFSQDLLGLYSACKVRNYKVATTHKGCTSYQKVRPANYNLDGLLKDQTLLQIVKYYLQIRIYEEQPHLTDIQVQQLVSKTMAIGKAQGNYGRAIKNFESVINKEFDKLRSFEYITRHLAAKADSLFDEGVIEALGPQAPTAIEMLEAEREFDQSMTNTTPPATPRPPQVPAYLDNHTPTENVDEYEDPSSFGTTGVGGAMKRRLGRGGTYPK